MEFKIENVEVYGIKESVIASGYPKSINTKMVDYSKTRANKLSNVKKGSGHDCFLKGIIIQADITATIKWWVQWGRYHFSDIISSQSTIHKIKDFNLDNAYIDYVDNRMIEIMKELKERYNNNPTIENFYKLIYSNPSGMMLTARITTNYLQEKTVYPQRKNHKLKKEWGNYCNWIETLPCSEWITNGL